ncbi:hypothetical protein MRX96_046527 [Rhipicephalus microplus]
MFEQRAPTLETGQTSVRALQSAEVARHSDGRRRGGERTLDSHSARGLSQSEKTKTVHADAARERCREAFGTK